MGNKVLYLHAAKNPANTRRFLEGMLRFARTVGWRVEPVQMDGLSPAALRELVRADDVIGCVRNAEWPRHNGAERSFTIPQVPVVVVDPRETDRSRRAGAVFCDNAAIAKSAFRELSAGRPPSFAAVTYWNPSLRWAKERIDSFRALCSESRRECVVFPPNGVEPPEARMARLEEWAAALPNNVAIFAVNDFTAVETAIALHSRHRHIPKTATLVGVDGAPERHDIPPSPVPLSSVDVNFESAGFLAARTLADILAVAPAGGISDSPCRRYGPLMVVRRESTRGRGRREPFVLEAAEAIHREACDGLTAAALAARFPVSRKHFERRFREATGHSVLDEILNVRLEQVQAYLLRRNVAIDAIAGLCGFGSEIELRRLFHRRFGMSMSEWRTRNSV
jgi:AraC-like DNA-binding protein